MAKSNELPEKKQIRIAKEYEKAKESGHKITYKELARKHNCTFDQVRRYVKAFQAGLLGVVDSGSTKKNLEAIFELHQDVEADVLTNQIEIIEAQLKSCSNLEISLRAGLTTDLAALKYKKEQYQKIAYENEKIEFTRIFLYKLCKHFRPNISQEEAIRIIRSVSSET